VAKEGLRGLYAGYGAFMLRDLPFDAIEFVAYEQIKQAARRALKRDPNAAEVSLIGAAAGGFTGALACAGRGILLLQCWQRPCAACVCTCLVSPAKSKTHTPQKKHNKTGIVTTPLDVLKTRLMTQGASGRYKNLVDATLQIARTEGAAAFMSGWQPRLIWISLGGFVFFPALEAAKQAFGPAGGLLTPPNTELVIEELEAKDAAAARKRAAAAKKKE
jgi:solute carrier family 25 S-adenosylmethionine transporter 26